MVSKFKVSQDFEDSVSISEYHLRDWKLLIFFKENTMRITFQNAICCKNKKTSLDYSQRILNIAQTCGKVMAP